MSKSKGRRRKGPHLCRGKKIYSSRSAAGKAAGRRLESRNNAPAALRVYHCGECKGYHLTSQPE